MRQIGLGVNELWSDIQTHRQTDKQRLNFIEDTLHTLSTIYSYTLYIIIQDTLYCTLSPEFRETVICYTERKYIVYANK